MTTRIRALARAAMIAGMALAAADLPSLSAAGETKGTHWPQFRGPGALGIAEGYPTPRKWDATKGKGIRWKTPIPGLGLSSPIIWDDRIYLTTAVRAAGDQELRVGLYGDIQPVEDDSEFEWQVLCIDAGTGEVIWTQTACRGVPKVKRHTKASHANSTAATDGKHVVAMFGSEGLYCYDAEKGNLLWKKDFGLLDSGYFAVPTAQWGFGSSPVIHDGKLLLQVDVQKDSFIAAFDVHDGKELWRTSRDEVPTWSSPAVCDAPGGKQVVANGFKHIGGYDLATGKELWKLEGGGDIPVPTPVFARGLIYITNAHGWMMPIYAVRPTASGSITLKEAEDANEHVAWWAPRGGNYMQTPLVYGDHVYSCQDTGVLTCYDAETGSQVYRQRIGKGLAGFTASAVAANKRLYYTCEDGDIYVIRAGPKYKRLAVNPMGEVCMATPAISRGVLYVRGAKHLFAIEPETKKKAGPDSKKKKKGYSGSRFHGR